MVRTRWDGGCAHRRTRNLELGVRDSEFLSVVRSMADGLREACGTLWMSIPTQTGFSRYSGPQMRTCTQLQMIIKIEFDKKQETYVVHGPDLLQVFLEMFRFSKIGFSFVERDIVWVIPLIFPLKPEITIDREK